MKLSYLTLVYLAAAACTQASAQQEEEPKKPEKKPVNIRVEPVTLQTLTEYITVSGQTLATARVTYSAEVPGRLDMMAASLGTKVRRGQVLARIDYKLQKAQADAATANYQLAKKTFERIQKLEADKLVSQQQIDEAQTQALRAEAQMRIAEANLDKAVIRASHDGTVIRKAAEAGEYAAPGMPLYEIVDYGTIEVQAQLPEKLATRVEAGSAAKVRINALDGKELDGTVSVVVPAAAKISKTFELRVLVDNPERNILVGMAASVRILAKLHEGAVVASQDVVVEEGDQQRSVFVEADGVAHKRSVTLGAAVDGKVILEEGLSEGDRLVVLGHRELVDGQPVRVIQ